MDEQTTISFGALSASQEKPSERASKHLSTQSDEVLEEAVFYDQVVNELDIDPFSVAESCRKLKQFHFGNKVDLEKKPPAGESVDHPAPVGIDLA